MPSFCAVFKCGNNFNSDGDKSCYWLPAVVTRLSPLREKLSREKEREMTTAADISRAASGSVDVCSACVRSFSRDFW